MILTNSTGIDDMIANKVVISIIVSLLLVSLLGISFAEKENVNVTNISQSGDILINETNQSYQNLTNGTAQRIADGTKTNDTDNAVSQGGIKNFMKSFKYQSEV
ncbi:hypothetical protein [uncultured Methanospirillum sp.]|uniref:hypothetical protein n=1 Tax=uncultured Methanospirillum sp. TaxID=262503 RepID=UPI0029C74CE7|nr:hypothetical protein [uncultured Methanospirillum sp.]